MLIRMENGVVQTETFSFLVKTTTAITYKKNKIWLFFKHNAYTSHNVDKVIFDKINEYWVQEQISLNEAKNVNPNIEPKGDKFKLGDKVLINGGPWGNGKIVHEIVAITEHHYYFGERRGLERVPGRWSKDREDLLSLSIE